MYNNNKFEYGTCMLVKKEFNISNIVKDSDDRVICMDIDDQLVKSFIV